MCLYFFSSVWNAEWPPFGKALLTKKTICSLCILTICSLGYFPFWFWGWVWVLVAWFPGLCIRFTFSVDGLGSTCPVTIELTGYLPMT